MKKKTTEKKKTSKPASTETPVVAPSGEKRTSRAVARYLRISPQRVRVVLNTVRFKPAYRALDILKTINQKAARLTTKVLNSAIANAKDNDLELNRLYISDIRADGGPVLKRFQPRSMGRADRILKRTSHISVVLTEGNTVWKAPAGLESKQEEQSTPKGKAAKSKAAGAKKKKAAKAGA